jgi:hypothetical protein
MAIKVERVPGPGEEDFKDQESQEGQEGQEGQENQDGGEGQEGQDGGEDQENQDGGEGQEGQDGGEGQDSEIGEEHVLNFLKNKYGKDVSSIDEIISEPQDIPEDVQAFLKYREETGRGYEDYLKLNRDISSVGDDQVLREYYMSQEPDLDPEDIDVLMQDYSYDEDIDEESDISKKKIKKKRDVAKARKFFESQKEQYYKPIESVSSDSETQEIVSKYNDIVKQAEDTAKTNRQKNERFEKATSEFFSKFEGFKFKIGEGREEVYSPADKEALMEKSKPSNFVSKFVDENGFLKDAEGFHRAMAIAMDPDKFARHFYEKGMTAATESFDESGKNINGKMNRSPEQIRKDGIKAQRVDNGRDGDRLVIKKRK